MRRGICFFLRFLQICPAGDNRNDNQDSFFNDLLARVGRGGANWTRGARWHNRWHRQGARAVFAYCANREEVVVGRDAVEHARHGARRVTLRVVYPSTRRAT